MVVVKLIVIVLVLLFRLCVVDSDASSVIQRLIVRLEDPSSHPSSDDNCTLFKQIEVRFNFHEIPPEFRCFS